MKRRVMNLMNEEACTVERSFTVTLMRPKATLPLCAMNYYKMYMYVRRLQTQCRRLNVRAVFPFLLSAKISEEYFI